MKGTWIADVFGLYFWVCVGHEVTKIGLPETKLGIIPGAGGTQRLTRLLGLAKAKNLIFTGRALSAAQALDYGTFSTILVKHDVVTI